MSNTATAAESTQKFYTVRVIHPQHGMRKVEMFADSLCKAEEITASQYSATQWKVDYRSTL
jgi:hypothetical protein